MAGKSLITDALNLILRDLTAKDAAKLVRKGVVPENFRPYQSTWGGGKYPPRTAFYDPNYWSAVPDHMADEAGNVIASREALKPLVPHPYLEDVAPNDSGLMYRGMSADELADILLRREIKSKGDYNLTGQEGLTYFTTDPASAAYYASAYAPEQYKANMERPAYVIAAKRAEPKNVTPVEGVGSHEVGVNVPIPLEDIRGIYRGKTTAYDPGVRESGFYSAPDARLLWEQKALDDLIRGRKSGGRVGPVDGALAIARHILRGK